MQTVTELQAIRSFSFGSAKTDLRNVERLIISKYLGAPYKHRGRSLEGLDCWGFLKLVYRDLGFELFDIEGLEYEKAWALRRRDYFKRNYPNDWARITTPKILDGILFLNKTGVANHAGIMLTSWRFIHASRAGVIVSRLTEVIWRQRIEGFYRLRERPW